MAPRTGVSPTAEIRDAGALSRVCSPGVADDCRTIADDPGAARQRTVRGNSVAVVSDGSAVLGLGDIGARAALPVLEGKAALYKRFAGTGAWPLCLDVREVPDMVRRISAVASGFGGVSQEDVAARRHAAVVATGRSDQPNQINNVLAFPGIFRGLLDGDAGTLTLAAQCAATQAIADTVPDSELDAGHIVPDVFDENLVPAVARGRHERLTGDMTEARRQAARPRPSPGSGEPGAVSPRRVIAGLLAADVAFAYQQTAIVPAVHDVERSRARFIPRVAVDPPAPAR